MPTPTFAITQDPNFAGGTYTGVFGDVLQYTVRCTSGQATNYQALVAALTEFPINSPHPESDIMSVGGIRIVAITSPGSSWQVQVTYRQLVSGSMPPSALTAAQLVNLAPRVESITSDYYQQVSERDVYGDPIINSAGDPFDPPGTVDCIRKIVVISRYKAAFVGSIYAPYENTLNAAAFALPGIGNVAKRCVRFVEARPGNGFNATVVVSVATSGSFVNGETIIWGGGNSATYDGISGTFITIINPTASIASGTVLTGASSGNTATVNASVLLPPVQVLGTFEVRQNHDSDGGMVSGFDYIVADKGQNGYWVTGEEDGGDLKKGRIYLNGEPVPSPVPLHLGAPADQTSYDTDNPQFSDPAGGWVTTQDKLAARKAAGTVTFNAGISPAGDFLQFQRIPSKDWSDFPL